MKQRNPLLYYLGGWASGGIFWLYWPFLMACDINNVSKGYFPKLGILARSYVIALVTYAGLVGYQLYRIASYAPNRGQAALEPPSGAYIALLLIFGIFLYGVPAYLVARTAAFLRAKNIPAFSGVSAIALFAFYGISLPFLQAKLNEFWRNRQTPTA